MNVIVDGLMANYVKTGKGPVIVCLPGWGDDAKSFADLAQRLGRKFQLLILDLPGFGGSQAPPEAWGLDEYARFVSAWLKKIGAGGIEAVIGHSYGGAVAVTALADGNIKSRKLILLASAGIRNKNRARKSLLKLAAKAGKVPLVLLPGSRREALKSKFYNSIGSDLKLLPHMEETYRKMISQDIRPAAQRLTVPTLLLYGVSDKSTPATDGHMLNRSIKGSRLEILNAGHFLHQEQPDKVAKLITDYIR